MNNKKAENLDKVYLDSESNFHESPNFSFFGIFSQRLSECVSGWLIFDFLGLSFVRIAYTDGQSG